MDNPMTQKFMLFLIKHNRYETMTYQAVRKREGNQEKSSMKNKGKEIFELEVQR